MLSKPPVYALLGRRGVFDVTFDMCAFNYQLKAFDGSDVFANMRGTFRTNILALATLGRQCPRISPSQQHHEPGDLEPVGGCAADCLLVSQRIA